MMRLIYGIDMENEKRLCYNLENVKRAGKEQGFDEITGQLMT